jgi:hypothetical protein
MGELKKPIHELFKTGICNVLLEIVCVLADKLSAILALLIISINDRNHLVAIFKWRTCTGAAAIKCFSVSPIT